MTFSFSSCVRAPEHVMISEIDGEAVLLNLQSETYFGLDRVGGRMWDAMTKAGSVDAALESLKGVYDVDERELRQDLADLVGTLLAHGLLEIRG